MLKNTNFLNRSTRYDCGSEGLQNTALLWHKLSSHGGWNMSAERSERSLKRRAGVRLQTQHLPPWRWAYRQCGFCFSVIYCQSLNLSFVLREENSGSCHLELLRTLTRWAWIWLFGLKPAYILVSREQENSCFAATRLWHRNWQGVIIWGKWVTKGNQSWL